MNEAITMLCGILIGAGIGIGVVITVEPTHQELYQRVHKGYVKCLDTPDGKVYCYEVKKDLVK